MRVRQSKKRGKKNIWHILQVAKPILQIFAQHIICKTQYDGIMPTVLRLAVGYPWKYSTTMEDRIKKYLKFQIF